MLCSCKKAVTWSCKIRSIHHECPCRIEIFHLKPHPWLSSDPEGEISLSYMDRLIMDCSFPTFLRFFARTLRKKREHLNFLIVDLTFISSSRVFFGY